MASKLLRIHGKVQGVYYRDNAVAMARAAGVAGWVRNRSDGTVEALLEGPAEQIERMLAWAHRGPEAARVDRIDISEGHLAGEPVCMPFERLPTL
ncbi:MAG: acylphosphatase [Laribacter sp.]|nr:acylphosphatase [Laribacter sp.]MBP9528407.1 acylphosphatase [Laribacter sp.]MBP9608257.1 acylphosphatase [Laribacter sp.]